MPTSRRFSPVALRARVARVALAVSVAAAVSGCGVPHTVIAPAPAENLTPGPVPIESGFLSDYTLLRPTEQFGADLKIYRDVSRKTGYRRILFRPVEIWRGSEKRLEDVSEEDLQYLADALYQAMQARLSRSFEMVSKPAPGVLEVSLAFTLVTNPDSKIDFFSTEVPVKDLSRREGPLVSGTRRFVRDCALEVQFTEAISAEKPKHGEKRPKLIRAEVFDVRRGGEAAKGTVNTWEDVHAVFERWATLLDERLESLRDGTFKPTLTVKEKNPPAVPSQRQ